MKSIKVAAMLLILAIMASAVLADTIAYVVPAGTMGNQAFTGSLGMDFTVNQDIVVTQLGVFHDGTSVPDLLTPLEARLYSRDDNNPCNIHLLATLDFTPCDEGTLMDSSYFLPLPAPITLPAGFTGTIVASGYGVNGETNGNSGGNPAGWTTNDGGGLISFVGGGRYGDPSMPEQFPTNPDGGPANRYAAGTFVFTTPGGDAEAPPLGIPRDCGAGKVYGAIK